MRVMAEKTLKSIITELPPVTVAVALASLLATILPGLSSVLIFDRNALLGGEIWRLFTCHFVHFSAPHLIYNLLVFAVSGYIIEKNRCCRLGWLCLWLAFAISLSLFVLKPDMAYYGGLSGVACGTLYFCALMGKRYSVHWRTMSFLIIFLVPLKIAIEMFAGASVLPYGEQQSFVPMPTSHIVGCVTAIVLYLIQMKGKDSAKQALQTSVALRSGL